MEQSAIVGFSAEFKPQEVHVFKDSPLCSLDVFAQIADVSPDVVRGWVETHTVPTVKVGRRRLINLHQLKKDLELGKTIFCQGDYEA